MTTVPCRSEAMAVTLFDPHAFAEAKSFQDRARFFRASLLGAAGWRSGWRTGVAVVGSDVSPFTASASRGAGWRSGRRHRGSQTASGLVTGRPESGRAP